MIILMVLIFIFVIGLIFGSFVNALVWRIYEQTKLKPNSKKSKELSILRGRSMCPHCKHALTTKDLIPVFSWLSLRGKCRYCKKPISAQYPLVELATGVLFLLSYVFWPYDASGGSMAVFCLWLVCLTGLVALAVYDLKWMELPNKIIYSLLPVAIAITVLSWLLLDADVSLLGVGSSIIIAGGLFYLLFTISDGRWIGGGDVKYGLMAGVLLANPYSAFMMITLASILGTLVILIGMATKKVSLKSQIPFGPFLIMATIIVFIFGVRLTDWYQATFLLVN